MKAVIDRAIGALRTLGADVVDPVVISDLIERVNKPYDGNVFETEPAMNAYWRSTRMPR